MQNSIKTNNRVVIFLPCRQAGSFSAKKNILISCLLFFSTFGSWAQTFPCDNGARLYFFQATGGNGSLSYITNYTTTPVITQMFTMSVASHNALGANPVDNYLYFLSGTTLNRLNTSGNATVVCTFPSGSIYGCFDSWGRFWVVNGGSLLAYDINTCAMVKGPYNIVGGAFLDIAYNPFDCYFYFSNVRCDTNGVVDPSYPGTQFSPSGTYGGVAIGSNGNIYGIAGSAGGGNLSMIDITLNTSNNVFNYTPGPTAGQSDMASFVCLQPVQANFVFATTSCSNTVTFTDSSLGNISTWSWNFGDALSGPNNNSTIQNPIHNFSSSGTYTVTLIVNSLPCFPPSSDTLSLIVTVSSSSTTVTSTVLNAISCFGNCNANANANMTGGTAPFIYSWNNGQTTQIASGLCAGNYTVVVTDAIGCSNSSTITITQPAIAVSITLSSSSSATCSTNNGSATVLGSGGTGAVTYSWNSTPVQTGATASSLGAGAYTVTATDANGCSATLNVNINDTGVPTGSLNSQTNITCNGLNNGSATVSAIGGLAPLTYTWNTIPVQTSTTATNLPAGTWTVTVTDSTNCSSVQSVTITEPAALSTIISVVPASCISATDGSATATTTGGTGIYTYAWLPSGGSASTASSLAPGNYTVTVTDGNGCIISNIATITANPLPIATASNTGAYCEGDTIYFIALGGSTYSWSGPSGFSSTTQNAIIPSSITTMNGVYTVTVSNTTGCTATAVTNVSVNAMPVVVFTGDPLQSCILSCVTFTDQSVITGSTITGWYWNIEGQSPNTNQNPTVCFTNTGSYDVSLTVTTTQGCSNSLSITNYITLNPSPQAGFLYSPIIIKEPLPIVNFANTSTGGISFIWNFGDGSTSNLTNPTYTYQDTGTFCISLIVTNSLGCTDTATGCIYVQPEFTIYIPNTFTVNNDGLNEIWQIYGRGVKALTAFIFNRWGEEIYQFNSINKGWSGTLKSGEPCQQGVYVYRVEVIDQSNKSHNYSGHINLLR